MTVKEVHANEYAQLFTGYMESVDQTLDLREGMRSTLQPIVDFFSELSEDQGDLRYAADKWSIKEVFQHMIDTERIFVHRLFRLGRRDDTPIEWFQSRSIY
ncbi:MAG: DinB family protein [Saprospiraceae bacterium]|nr:DinB family protein [Saprospiraceae bacterium]